MGDTFNCQSIYIYNTLPPGDNGGFGSTDPLQIQQPDLSKTTGQRKTKVPLPTPSLLPAHRPLQHLERTRRRKELSLLRRLLLKENYTDDSGEQNTGEGHGHQSKKQGEKSGEKEQ